METQQTFTIWSIFQLDVEFLISDYPHQPISPKLEKKYRNAVAHANSFLASWELEDMYVYLRNVAIWNEYFWCPLRKALIAFFNQKNVESNWRLKNQATIRVLKLINTSERVDANLS